MLAIDEFGDVSGVILEGAPSDWIDPEGEGNSEGGRWGGGMVSLMLD